MGGNGGHIATSYSTSSVSGNWGVGGLVGKNEGSIISGYSTGAVSGNGWGVGGLVGIIHGYDGRITRSYSTGPVSGIIDYGVGGLVGSYTTEGYPGLPPRRLEQEVVFDCFWDIETSGQLTSEGGEGKSTAEMQDGNTFISAGWDFVGEAANGTEDIWKIAEGLSYPRLSWEKYSGGTGEPNDPYQIATAADLIALGETPDDYDKHFILTADIDLDPNLPGRKVFDQAVIAPPTLTPTAFTGVFDGNAHTISHLTISGSSYLGLFGKLGWWAEPEGEVRDLGVVDVNITCSNYYVGGLVGLNWGVLTQCYSTGSVTGNSSVGGLVGSNCASIATSWSTSTVGGETSVGGLVGGNWEEGNVTQCYSTGAVSGSGDIGGLVGLNHIYELKQGVVTDCFWDTQTSGQATSAGGTGKTTAEMQTASTFLEAGWDFVGETTNGTEDLWWILEGKDYPRLWWETHGN